jgi:hypothetical protein
MLTNATILRIDAAAAKGPDGTETWTEGSAVSIRCSWQRPRTGQKWIEGAAIADAAAVLYVGGNRSGAIESNGRVLVRVDGESADRLYTVLAVEPAVGGLSNTEVYLKG